MDMLETAKPFDRAFIDAMIVHHQGAIRMSQIELADGTDEQTKSLADEIIDAQSMEITEMNEWREVVQIAVPIGRYSRIGSRRHE